MKLSVLFFLVLSITCKGQKNADYLTSVKPTNLLHVNSGNEFWNELLAYTLDIKRSELYCLSNTHLFKYFNKNHSTRDSVPTYTFYNFKTRKGYNPNILFNHDTLYVILIKIFQDEQDGQPTHLVFCFDPDLRLLSKDSFYSTTFNGNLMISSIRKVRNSYIYGKEEQRYYYLLSKDSAIYCKGGFNYTTLSSIPDSMLRYFRENIVRSLDSKEGAMFNENLIFDYVLTASKKWFYLANSNGRYKLFYYEPLSHKMCFILDYVKGPSNPRINGATRVTNNGIYWIDHNNVISFIKTD